MSTKQEKRIAQYARLFRVKPGSRVRLGRDFDPGFKADVVRKKDGAELLRRGVALPADYQARLAAQDTHGVLVCLQALDAGGKDGTIRHVMSGVNPQGVSVHSFKVPSAEEPDHDYLWRYARCLPERGEIGIFNRSHYEEVVVVRVHREILDRQKLPPQNTGAGIWERRYREINNWERYLPENGIRVVKLFLNLSQEEQRTRFLKRLDLPEDLEVLVPRHRRTRALGRLPDGVLRDAVPHEHTVGAVVRHPRRPQVVRPDRVGHRARERADRARPAVPDGPPSCAQGARQGEGGAPGTLGIGGRIAARARRPERAPDREAQARVAPVPHKTGTLTMNQMTAVEVVGAADRYTISGIGYGLDGRVHHAAGSSEGIEDAILPSVIANDARLESGRVVGDPTDGALLVLAHKAGLDIEATRDERLRLATLPFDPTYKLMATFNRETDGSGDEVVRVYVKGAAPAVLERAGSAPADGGEHVTRMEGDGLRVMAAAVRDLGPEGFDPDGDLLAHVTDLEVTSLVGMLDPPRDESKQAVEEAGAAHIRVRMVTGDDVVTGAAIAEQLGIRGEAILGADFAAMPEAERMERIETIGVLWIQFLISAPFGVALGFGQETPGLMRLRPRERGESILTSPVKLTAGLVGLFMAVASLIVLEVGTHHYASARTGNPIAFTAFALMLVAAAFECRSETRSILTTDTFNSRRMNMIAAIEVIGAVLATGWGFLNRLLGTVQLTTQQFGVALTCALALLVAWEAAKAVARRRTDAPGGSPAAADGVAQ